ncbi:MAG: PEP-CTERM sorting domain-containing protein [Terriglobales bacterium]
MSSRTRSLLSLFAALSLSALASADSIPFTTMSVRSNAFDNAHTDSVRLSTNTGTATPVTAPSISRTSGANWIAESAGAPAKQVLAKSDATTHSTFGGAIHGTLSHRNGEWAQWNKGNPSPLAAPEPGGLMLLSTGLLGVAGLLRRRAARE